LLVHDYLTVDGAKIAKSGAHAADPAGLAATYGADALRWWLLADPAPVGTTDFTAGRLVAAYNRDLANVVGNLASRTLTLARRDAAGRTEAATGIGERLYAQASALPAAIDAALANYDFRAACGAITALAEAGNRFIEAEAPWHLANAAATGDTVAAGRFHGVIDPLLSVCRVAADELVAFIPDGATRLRAQLDSNTAKPAPAFPRITA
jgi:methionyl-tRNA synthetase